MIVGFIIMFSFLKARLLCAFFNWSGNFPCMIHRLTFCKRKLPKVAALSLIMLKGISSNFVDFQMSLVFLLK